MADISTRPAPGKRSLQDLRPQSGDEDSPLAKRVCLESPPASAHLTLLEELCELEEDDAESCLRTSATEVSTQEDLVAEMMKSLEKVIEGGESSGRGEGEVSSSHPSSEALSPGHDASTFGLDWTSEGCPAEASFHGGLDQNENDFNGDARIQHLLQASDDELGIPLSSSSSDLEDSSFHDEWASLTDETGPSFNLNWLDGSLQQLEDVRDFYEPVILF